MAIRFAELPEDRFKRVLVFSVNQLTSEPVQPLFLYFSASSLSLAHWKHQKVTARCFTSNPKTSHWMVEK